MRISDWSSDVCSSDLAALPGTIRLRHSALERDYRLGQQTSAVAGGGAREEAIDLPAVLAADAARRSEEHTSELQSLMRISYAVFCLKKKTSASNCLNRYSLWTP